VTADELDALAERIAGRLAVPRTLTLAAAARYLGVSADVLYELLDAPGFPRRVKVGRQRRFVTAQLDSWLRNRPPARNKSPRAQGIPAESDR
jgi:excisionase family DNA binding protein